MPNLKRFSSCYICPKDLKDYCTQRFCIVFMNSDAVYTARCIDHISTTITHKFKHIIVCLAKGRKRTHCFDRNSSFCQVHVFEVLIPTSSYRQFIICTCFICQNFIPSKILSVNISCNFIYNGIFIFWQFYGSRPFWSLGTSKAFTLSLFPLDVCIHSPSTGHTAIYGTSRSIIQGKLVYNQDHAETGQFCLLWRCLKPKRGGH